MSAERDDSMDRVRQGSDEERITPRELLRIVRSLSLETPAEATEIIRADRDRRGTIDD